MRFERYWDDDRVVFACHLAPEDITRLKEWIAMLTSVVDEAVERGSWGEQVLMNSTQAHLVALIGGGEAMISYLSA
jgi:hypothetical protein